MTTAERVYQMTRVRAGDYLLPSNDGTKLWRIYSYAEEGSLVEVLSDGTERPIVGTFWAAALFERPVAEISGESLLDEDFLDWERWTSYEERLRTRAEAVAAALRSSATPRRS